MSELPDSDAQRRRASLSVLAILAGFAFVLGVFPPGGGFLGGRAAPGELLADYRTRLGADPVGAARALEPDAAARGEELLARGDATAWTELGLLLSRAGANEAGASALLRALELDPELADAWMWLGANRLSAGEPNDALVLLDRASELRGDAARIHRLRGEVHLRRGANEEAEEALRFAIGLAPDRSADARLRLAELLEAEGRPSEAIDELARLVDRDIAHVEALERIVALLEREGTDPARAAGYARLLERARVVASRGWRADPPPPERFHAPLGFHFLEEGRADLALSEFRVGLEAVTEPGPAREELYVGAARALLELDRAEEARELVEHLRSSLPEHPSLAVVLAMAEEAGI